MSKRKFKGTKKELERYFIKEWLPSRIVAEKFGVKKSCILSWAKKLGVKIPPCGGRNIKDLTGKRFGKLIVLKKDSVNVKRGTADWLCRCDCGTEKVITSGSLRSGATTSCGCFRKEKMYKGYESLSGCLWERVKKGAKKRNLEFKITIKEAWELFEKQKRKCALSGVSIVLVRDLTRDRKKNTASLDRKNSTKGYTKDNIQWVHKRINQMKNKHSDSDFIEWCKKVANYVK
jgi:hypothetical protein